MLVLFCSLLPPCDVVLRCRARGKSLNTLLPGPQLAGDLPEGTQNNFRSILTDEYMRVMGTDGSIYAMGDGATVYQVSVPQRSGCMPRECAPIQGFA